MKKWFGLSIKPTFIIGSWLAWNIRNASPVTEGKYQNKRDIASAPNMSSLWQIRKSL